ncbi:zinc finger CCCH-type antiviral protein 1-like isoform X2 [Amphibalanus amphitrite]|uniref:zinc finger CCCH-type antiviral protein 1-like isoform X2 n=1 Tax=Amphibalanus amphitrite TaxID=1232801 RepID=UPI001C92424D|nr:zinc finger CCCH-type antiviral protein 1-like isoform X2 [Amphibalanus amphitrite]
MGSRLSSRRSGGPARPTEPGSSSPGDMACGWEESCKKHGYRPSGPRQDTKRSAAEKQRGAGDKQRSAGDKQLYVGHKQLYAAERQRSAGDKQRGAGDKQQLAGEQVRSGRAQPAQKVSAPCEGAGERARAVPPLRLSLPGVCRGYSSREGCEEADCRGLHVCRQFLADICNYGADCRYSHSLTTVHNQDICRLFSMDTMQENVLLLQIRRAFSESDQLTEAFFVQNLTRCFRFRTKTPCKLHECNRLHLCRQFVLDGCRRADCRMGHDLRTAHNRDVLRRHRLGDASEGHVLAILRQKEADLRASQLKRKAAKGDGDVKKECPHKPGVSGAERAGAGPARAGPPSSGGGRLSEELRCPVCLELFRRATTLGCGHTFCAGCLAKTRDRGADRCPLCAAPICSTIRSVALDGVVRSVAAQK